jgi:hypothetical protein
MYVYLLIHNFIHNVNRDLGASLPHLQTLALFLLEGNVMDELSISLLHDLYTTFFKNRAQMAYVATILDEETYSLLPDGTKCPHEVYECDETLKHIGLSNFLLGGAVTLPTPAFTFRAPSTTLDSINFVSAEGQKPPEVINFEGLPRSLDDTDNNANKFALVSEKSMQLQLERNKEWKIYGPEVCFHIYCLCIACIISCSLI